MNIYLLVFNRKSGRIKNKIYNIEQISTKPNLFHLERKFIYDISRDCVWTSDRYSHSVILYKIPTEREIEKLKKAVSSIKE